MNLTFSGIGGPDTVDGLVVANPVTITNVTGIRLNVIAIAGPQGPAGPVGPAGTGAGGGGAAGVSSLNGLTGALSIMGAGGVVVSNAGSNLIVSGSGLASTTDIATTGSEAWNAANSNSINLSGALTATGADLTARDLVISGGAASGLAATGQTLNSLVIGLSGQASGTYATIANLALTGSGLYRTMTGMSGALVSLIGASAARVASLNGASGVVTIGGAGNVVVTTAGQTITVSGNTGDYAAFALKTDLGATGTTILARDLLTSGILATGLAATGSSLYGMVIGLSGQGTGYAIAADLTQTGVQLGATIASSGQQAWTAANTNSVILSGNLTATGATLFARDLAISGALQAAINAISGGGSTGVGGSGVPSVNGITSAVTIQGVGGLNATTQGTVISISGFNGVAHKQVLFVNSGVTTGDPLFTWDEASNSLSLGTAVILPSNPLAIAGSGNTYVQVNLQNRSAGSSAQSDYVLTADIGTDTNNFVDLGINNTLFSDTGYNLYKPLDGFLYNRGGDMFLGAAGPGGKVGIHAGGIDSGNLTMLITSGAVGIGVSNPSAALDVSGNIGMSGNLISAGITLDGVTVANRPMWAIIENGLARAQGIVGPALWSRQFTAILPGTTTSQTVIGNTATNVGTLATASSEILGQYTTIPTAATIASAGTQATTPYYYRGSMTGRNGFFFTSTFSFADGNNTTGAYGNISGSRIFIGMTDQVTTATVATNDPAGNRIGLSYIAASGGTQASRYDVNWLISSKDNSTEFTGVTPMTFLTGFYRFSMYCPPFTTNSSGIYWQLDDLIRGSGTAGIVTGRLPVGSTALRPSAFVANISGGVRNIRIMNLYTENPGWGG